MRKKIIKKLVISSLWSYMEVKATDKLYSKIKFIFICGIANLLSSFNVDIHDEVIDELSDEIRAICPQYMN